MAAPTLLDLGVLPTPGVAALAPELGASAAGVVSASHNPYQDNGVKFFSGEGRKLPPERERDLERLLSEDSPRPTGHDIGTITPAYDAVERYVNLVLERVGPCGGGAKVLLDCANGAAFETAPLAFGGLDVDFSVTGDSPTGTNINEGCGSTHVTDLNAEGFDVAFAFDGDADRVLAVDEKGNVVDGDRIIAILPGISMSGTPWPAVPRGNGYEQPGFLQGHGFPGHPVRSNPGWGSARRGSHDASRSVGGW